jgi:hypothetical protein
MIIFSESPSNSEAHIDKEATGDKEEATSGEREAPGAPGDKEGETPTEKEVTGNKEGETPSEKEALGDEEEEAAPTNTPSLHCSYKRCSNNIASK